MILICSSLIAFAGCEKSVDYTRYISEKRTEIYLYSDDETDVRIYCSEREQPYAADGYCGESCAIAEIFVRFAHNPDEVAASLGEHAGDMSYEAVENRYVLTFTAEAFGADSVELTLTFDGESKTYTALNVKSANLLSCEEALLCVTEYDRTLFENLTRNGVFDGEIYVRLLYDDGCYYYVGVCDKNKKINAYLLDGERGKVITTKQLQG